MNEVIENYLRTGETDIAEPYASLMKEAAVSYVQEIFQKLKDYEYNESLMQLALRHDRTSGNLNLVLSAFITKLHNLILHQILAEGFSANIREYNMNGTLILGIDHGYGNIKTAHRVFPTALIKSEKAPTFSKDYSF